ncbi:hypothetical protein [Amycolatopsis sp. NPDC052450]|uniref:hypothetical protein n=1 Tax=Amycolatopsis sp. NPDC052450 TaxID=3363937 RepID=UPI0037CBFBF4
METRGEGRWTRHHWGPVSVYHFIRVFKEKTGETPHRFLGGLRIAKAAACRHRPPRCGHCCSMPVPVMVDYQASVELSEMPGGGTRIHWHGTYRVGKGSARIFRWYLRRFMRGMAAGLADHAGGPARRP